MKCLAWNKLLIASCMEGLMGYYCPNKSIPIKQINDSIYLSPVLDLPIGSIGWRLGPQNLGGLRPRFMLFLTLLLDFHTYAVITYCTSVIFRTQLHSISEYCRILNTPHHHRLYWNWLTTLPSSSSHDGWGLGGVSQVE